MSRKGGWFQRLVFVGNFVFDRYIWEHAGAERCFSWRETKTTRRRGQTAVEASNNKEQTAVGEHQVQIQWRNEATRPSRREYSSPG